jgi:hypothetical protein
MNRSAHTTNPTNDTPSPEEIDGLEVKDAWKKTFRLIVKAEPEGFLKYKKLAELNSFERRKIQYNFIAFFFSAFYYLWKGMSRKGLVILGAAWLYIAALTFVEGAFSITLPNVVYYIPPSVICAMFANYDYYQKIVHKEEMWDGLEIFKKLSHCIFFAVGALLLLILSGSTLA